MIGKLRGIFDSIDKDKILVDVAGVYYSITVSSKTLNKITLKNEAVLYIETQFREDNISLFGFHEQSERDWFKMLITVKGLGPKIAIAILSMLNPQDLNNILLSNDKKSLQSVSGVGMKLAERIIIELKDKTTNGPTIASDQENDSVSDAVSALSNLGYQKLEAYQIVMNHAKNANLTTSELIRLSLRDLAK